MTITTVITLLASVSRACAHIPSLQHVKPIPAAGIAHSAHSLREVRYLPGAPGIVASAASSAAQAATSPRVAEQYAIYDFTNGRAHYSASPSSANKFDLVEFRGEMERSLFQRIVSRFSCPSVGGGRFSQTWWSTQNAMETKAVKDKNLLPMVAMKGALACAAGVYSDALTNDENTYVLSMLIRNSQEKECVGGGAAIMCQLIRNSRNREGGFSPLRLTIGSIHKEPGLKGYLETFGCTRSSQSFSWDCHDPNPSSCAEFADDGLHIPFRNLSPDASFVEPTVLSQISRDVISTPTVIMTMTMIGVLASSGIMFCMQPFRNSPSTMAQESLLAA
eukprot:gnl/TRDRNA2_/TRDRNA2_149454_c0_seq1.p1 gnl/TRDRNA2_/TRDRNA2_149454_c0~~gnl/TRDRNA2_/TRDRNA2_149454_c0_seq1.p1  ORF type:complete len:334 (+),score=26.46 gnl/TRDRNA2_/TRDRNA2_149454_c0_seq1:145-1146(+)